MTFTPGLDLAARFYTDAVQPLLTGVPHAAALIGPGSEVLGYDTRRSTDHDWGPHIQLFVNPPQTAAVKERLAALPGEFAGWPRVRPVWVTSVREWCLGRLGFDATAGIRTADWLATPAQLLAEATGGAVFHDDTGELTAVRQALTWYPDDIWRYVLAAQWSRIGEEEPFVGRCTETGDDLGATVVAARLARDLMRLCLLMARRYPPYSKWLGTAFGRLPSIAPVRTALTAALRSPAPDLSPAYEAVARLHNDLGLTPPLDPTVRLFYDRPFLVLGAGRFAEALQATITDQDLRARPLTGAVDQLLDNTLALSHPQRAHAAGLALTQVAGG